ncbi:MAG: RNA methyltransferase [Cyclobacteriaceae bacterium]|nr:MAG: RNA methyltransferase [Cyclobacteriaceae bacterium]
MLSKARIKFIKSLQLKKYRKQEQCFTVEGEKSVLEVLNSSLQVRELYATAGFIGRQKAALTRFKGTVVEVQDKDLASAGEYASNDGALAVVDIPENTVPKMSDQEFVLMLDDIRDPGNLGTIIRTADWYGVKTIIASEETTDVYNAKVIQASMGSFTRTRVYYTNLPQFLSSNRMPVYGTFLNGADAHAFNFGNGGIVVIGNEANGISNDVERFVTQKITIPRFGQAESLNAAIATAVILDNIRRR